MQLPQIPKFGRLSKKHKITVAGSAAAAAVLLTVTGLQVTGGSAVAEGDPTGFAVSAGEPIKNIDANAGTASQRAIAEQAAAKKHAADVAAAARKQAAADAAAKKKAAADAVAAKKEAAREAAAAKRKAAADALERSRAKAAANRSTHRATLKPANPKPAPRPVQPKPAPKPVPSKPVQSRPAPAEPAPKPATAVPAAKTYTDNLDGWIKESMDVMAAHGIPGSYNGIYRNIIRESSGNPQAINLWDINAQNGIPSKGLLQVIDPTFQTYHVDGTSWNIYDPVANITAACNYAYHRYGSMDNVYSAY